MKTRISPERADGELKRRTVRVAPEDLERVLDKVEAIEKKSASGPLAELLEEVRLFFALLRDYRAKRYRDIPCKSVTAIIAALLYILVPMDMVPDF
ncbi:MAG: hypothetical protein F6K17_24215, partial [Okeania sp. SIO3C4]|nr:hypothetical protein [Okeania sp. SIO3C4]